MTLWAGVHHHESCNTAPAKRRQAASIAAIAEIILRLLLSLYFLFGLVAVLFGVAWVAMKVVSLILGSVGLA